MNRLQRLINYGTKKTAAVFYGKCVVLLYHRVNDLATDPQLLSVAPAHFEKHLQVLNENYRVLKVHEFTDALQNKKKLPSRSVLITFDDGYADNVHNALPLLERYGMQSLFYVATATLNTSNEYWWDAMERIVLLSNEESSVEQIEIKGNIYNLRSTSRNELYETLLPVVRRMPGMERENYMAALATAFNSKEGRDTHRAMTYDELRKMAASPSAVVGAHTHTHPSLGALNYAEQEAEIKGSKNILESVIGQNIKHFSYPFGTVHDFNSDTIRICRNNGLFPVAANFPSTANALSDHYAFPRFLVRNWDEKTFRHQLQIFFSE